MEVLKKNKTIAGILALFLGTLGIHRFYMGEWKGGLIYLLFFWTGVPTILGIIDGARYFTEVAEAAPDVDDDTTMSKEKDSSINKDEDVLDESLSDETEAEDSVKADENPSSDKNNLEKIEDTSEEIIEEPQEDK